MKRVLKWSLLLLYACASKYKPLGFKGGYSDQKLGEDSYQVNFKGNGYTPRADAEKFAQLRAQDLCAQSGKENVKVLDKRDLSELSHLSAGFQCTRAGFDSMSCIENPDLEVWRPHTELKVQCFN